MEKVIGYKKIEKTVIFSRPCKWTGKGEANNGFRDLKPVKRSVTVFMPILEDLGPKVCCTMDKPYEEPTYTDLSFEQGFVKLAARKGKRA